MCEAKRSLGGGPLTSRCPLAQFALRGQLFALLLEPVPQGAGGFDEFAGEETTVPTDRSRTAAQPSRLPALRPLPDRVRHELGERPYGPAEQAADSTGDQAQSAWLRNRATFSSLRMLVSDATDSPGIR